MSYKVGTVHSCGRVIASPSGCGHCRNEQRRRRVRQAVDALGHTCVRCGIKSPLQFDHIHDDGFKNKTAGGNYRRIMHAEGAEITRILRTGKSDRLQLLCPNCNYLKHHDRAEFDRLPSYGPCCLKSHGPWYFTGVVPVNRSDGRWYRACAVHAVNNILTTRR